MVTHSSVLAWRIPGPGEPGGAAVYGVAQSRTRLKRLSSKKFLGAIDSGLIGLHAKDLLIDMLLLSLGIR